jgi:hypothetical protein
MMEDRSSYSWIQPSKMGRMFAYVFVFTVIVIISLQVLGAPLKTAAAPGGIISFEFSGDLPTAQAILASWGEDGKIYAGLQLGLDYLFMPAYALAIGLACVLVSKSFASLAPLLEKLGVWLAWGQWAAAGLDAVENYSLIRLLVGSDNTLWPSIAYWSAAIKFGLVIIGLIYVVVGAARMLLARSKSLEAI